MTIAEIEADNEMMKKMQSLKRLKKQQKKIKYFIFKDVANLFHVI